MAAITQIKCRGAIKSTSSPQISAPDHEGGRAPQPQWSVIETVARHSAQRIGVGQRNHRRPQAGGGRVDQEYQHGPLLGTDGGKADGGRKRGDDQRSPQRIAPFGQAGDERQGGKSRQRRHCGNNTDPRRVDPDGLQPHREKRQLGAPQSKQRAVK